MIQFLGLIFGRHAILEIDACSSCGVLDEKLVIFFNFFFLLNTFPLLRDLDSISSQASVGRAKANLQLISFDFDRVEKVILGKKYL